MYRTVQGAVNDVGEANRFIEELNQLGRHRLHEARTLFGGGEDIIAARAPGRLDVMGGIADYSGSLVLQLPLKEATWVAVQPADDRLLKILSLNTNDRQSPYFEMSLDDFEKKGRPVDYLSAQRYFQAEPKKQWAAYAAGVFLALMIEQNIDFRHGVRILIYSGVPQGRGVSSSAALEVAVLSAVDAAYGLNLNAREIAGLCQLVENKIVGAPCGIMDQMTSACGKRDKLLSLLCQPAMLNEFITIPDHIAFYGIDSGISHDVSGFDYTAVRVGAFMGYRIIAEAAGLDVSQPPHGQQVSIEDPKWHGYLANLSPQSFNSYSALLPDELRGGAFLTAYGGTSDAATEIDPQALYPVAKPTGHPIFEHARVNLFARSFDSEMDASVLKKMGHLMYQSHDSYSACGLGSRHTDRIVEIARSFGPDHGIYGARITGGGSGGTVAVLAEASALQAIEQIADQYRNETRKSAQIFAGSSAGAGEFGFLVLRQD